MIRPRWMLAGVFVAALVGRPACAGLNVGSLDMPAAHWFDASLTGADNGTSDGAGFVPESTNASDLSLHLQADDSITSGSHDARGSDNIAVPVPEPAAILFGAVVNL